MKNKIKKYFYTYIVIYITTLTTIILSNIVINKGFESEIGFINTLIFLVLIELFISLLIFLGYLLFIVLLLKVKIKNIEISILIIISLLSYNLIPKDLLLNLDVMITRNLSAILPVIYFIIYGLFVNIYFKRKLI